MNSLSIFFVFLHSLYNLFNSIDRKWLILIKTIYFVNFIQEKNLIAILYFFFFWQSILTESSRKCDLLAKNSKSNLFVQNKCDLSYFILYFFKNWMVFLKNCSSEIDCANTVVKFVKFWYSILNQPVTAIDNSTESMNLVTRKCLFLVNIVSIQHSDHFSLYQLHHHLFICLCWFNFFF